MKTKDIIEGLTIIEKYRDRTDGYNTGAGHDQIYAYATDRPVNEEDLKRLTELGWFQPDLGDEAPYDPTEGWSCVV